MSEESREVRHYTDRVMVLGKPMCLEAVLFDHQLSLLLYGGDAPHIGSAAVLSPDGSISVQTFPGHREDVICSAWAKALLQAGWKAAVISAGIHYDGLDRAGIRTVLDEADAILQRFLKKTADFEANEIPPL